MATPSRSSPNSLADYLALHIQRPQYICSPVLPRGRTVLLVGDSTQGKTPFAYQLARDVAAGNAVLDHFSCSGPRRVAYIDAESTEEDVGLRVQMQQRRPADTGDRFIIRNRQQVYEEGLTVTTTGRDKLLAFVVKESVDLLVLDNLFALSGGQDTSKSNVVQPILTGLKRITDLPHKPTVAVLHHRRKGGTNDRKRASITDPNFMLWLEEASGSGVLVNLTDVRLGLERIEIHGEEVTVLRGRSRVPGEEQDIGPLYLSIDEEHAIASIDHRPEVLDEQGDKIRAVLDLLRSLGWFTPKDAIRESLRLSPSPSAKTVRRAIRFAREHGFIAERSEGFQWR